MKKVIQAVVEVTFASMAGVLATLLFSQVYNEPEGGSNLFAVLLLMVGIGCCLIGCVYIVLLNMRTEETTPQTPVPCCQDRENCACK